MTVHPKSEDFIQLCSGVDFYFMDPNPDDIHVEDIAHTLSLLCRFGGHCREFYSVAEHSVRCSWNVPKEFQFEALMHDASEAYLVDMPRPIKNKLQGYRDLEANLDIIVREKFGLPAEMTDTCKWIDNTMLATERRDLMPSTRAPWIWLPDPLEEIITPWSPKEAQEQFMKRFGELYEG